MSRLARKVAAVAVLTVVAVVAATMANVAPGPSAPAAAAVDRLTWTSCRNGMQCTTIAVPARYDDPGGGQFEIRVARVPAGDPGRRIGSLVVNPGGPGLSSVDALRGIAASLPAQVTDRFDVVAIDPRGVGRSAPVECGVPLDPVFDQSFSPTTTRARDALVAAIQTVAEGCVARDAARLGAVSTADTARDMDLVRERLGDEELTYLGFSYGTLLGALYAAEFPDRVRALVLDGAIDPTIDARASTLLQARGFETSLDQFLAWCADTESCAFRSDGDPAGEYDALRARVAEAPMRVDPDATGDRAGTTRVLNDTRFDAAVLLHLYSGRSAWPALADLLAEAVDGHAARLLVAADRFLGRTPGGGDNGSVEAFWAVGCLDDPTSARIGGLQPVAEAVAPRIGAFVANFSLACSVWPTHGESPTTRSPAVVASITDSAPGALVVGTTDDPATPLVAAKRLARLLGDAALVVARGNRHTAVGAGNECVDRAVARYLVSPAGSMPARRRC